MPTIHRVALGAAITASCVLSGCVSETGTAAISTPPGATVPALPVQQVTAAPTPVAATSTPIELWRNGIRLAGTLQVPPLTPGERVPLVIIMHGFSGNQNEPLNSATALALQNAGIAALRFDFDGHGASGGRQQDMTIPAEIEDARTVYDYARGLPFVSSIGLTGHSQGGVVASMLAGELGEQISALALFAPAGIIPAAARSGNFLGTRFDTADPPEYIDTVNDFRIGREYIRTAQTLPLEQVAAQYAGPVTVIQGADDQAVPVDASQKFVTLFRHGEIHVLPGQDHVFTADPELPAQMAAEFLATRLRA